MTWNVITALAVTLAATPALAEFPEKPIEIVVGYAAGGGTDVLARTVGQFLEGALGDGAAVVVKNVPGAGGQIGFTEVATADPDGYTLGTFNLPAALALTYDRNADYDEGSFTYLANFVDDPNTIVVGADSEFTTLDDFLTAAEAEPGAITVGLSSLGGNDHFAAIMIEQAAGAEFTLVPFKGAALARTALMGGHVAAGTMALSQTTSFGDDIKVLAVLADERSSFAPDVPTAKELGYDVEMSSLRGIVGPAGMDPALADQLRQALSAVNDNPEFQAMMAEQGNPMAFVTGDDFAKLAAEQSAIAKSIWEPTPWQ
ncbi:tripartite tricarboxylate transporter substrate binding protein [Paracoccus sp. SCSIO 75233]|uniref:tripartite tricarboxylate transporter substrate binding protein n=1 Tax=Paracoccus sp. SCSIO 75233 TaxID=3017782 RepID=UPI0022F04BA0|nr:tripartite tricarboxylate transporter substrate binding protein [Paracoccus sp. SCSIO 75233]WBU53977.1 tripartite tricarboxylate transporter substrate binding protein [Paracoccus sp. SCSIO 75233]